MKYKNEIEKVLGILLTRIKQRCSKHFPSHHNYYDRGISICNEWLENSLNFVHWAIKNGYKKGLEIDRIDVNGNYCPENCRFTTKSVNSQNTRKLQRNTSGYRGVHFHKRQKLFVASICIERNLMHIGTYNTALEAAKAYDTYVIRNKTAHGTNGVVKTKEDEVEANTCGLFRSNTSGVRGVDFMKKTGLWRVRIMNNSKRTTLGYFKTFKEAEEYKNKYDEINPRSKSLRNVINA